MASPRLFRLKAEVIPRPVGDVAKSFSCARIWVDTGVFHLDAPFDYSVPEALDSLITCGVRVQVPFAGREVEGIVIERREAPQSAGRIRTISKVLSPHAVATSTSLHLYTMVAARWATNINDVIRLAIPPRVASIDKTFKSNFDRHIPVVEQTSTSQYFAFHAYEDPAKQAVVLITRMAKRGSLLLVAPDEKDLDQISSLLIAQGIHHLRIDSAISRADRYRNYLLAMNTPDCIVLGARSAIFTPVAHLRTLIVYKESAHEHFELRSPGCNVRDIAFIRAEKESVDVIFTGYVPSIELSFLIDNKKLKYVNDSFTLRVKAFSSENGTLLPGRIFTDIRKGLSRGPVLFLVPRKGYGNAVLCAHCKNVAQCTCGGRLVVAAKGADPRCTLCNTVFFNWTCTWCSRQTPYLAGRGIERAGEEISRAFTGFPLILSFGDVIKSSVSSAPALVLATPGAAPHCVGGYSAVVILEALNFFSHPDIRSQERARELFFETAALIGSKGSVLISIVDGHPIVSSLSKWNPGAMIRRELSEREEVGLPPFVHSIVILSPLAESSQIVAGLHKAIHDMRLPQSVTVLGPTPIEKNQAKIVMYISPIEMPVATAFIHELQRRRSIGNKQLLTIRVDPYSL